MKQIRRQSNSAYALALLLAIPACRTEPPRSRAKMQDLLDDKLNQAVTLVGMARHAHSGAVILVQGGPIYIEGLAEWPHDLDGKNVRVTGVLRDKKLAPDPVVDEKGAVSHGMFGSAYVIENPVWERAP
jgi:hypothetical protein